MDICIPTYLRQAIRFSTRAGNELKYISQLYNSHQNEKYQITCFTHTV